MEDKVLIPPSNYKGEKKCFVVRVTSIINNSGF